MDGSKLLISFALLALLTSCSSGNDEGKLITKDTAGCIGAQVPGQFIVNWADGTQSLEHAESRRAFIDGFLKKHSSEIVFAEPDYRIQLSDIPSPFVDVETSSSPPNWGASAIGAQKAWDQGYEGQGVIVAVVDSGADLTHPQLANQVAINTTELNGTAGVDDDGNGLIDDIRGYDFYHDRPEVGDDVGHGTHVSGTVLAEHSMGRTLGIAPQAKLLPVEFIGKNGGLTSDAIASLWYAVSRGAKVINASWGSDVCSQSLSNTFNELQHQNILVVIAAGNNGNDLSIFPEFPAALKGANMFTIGAANPSGLRAFFSNYGKLVHFLAPGENIESTFPITETNKTRYQFASGTSMAAPHVSGMAAVLWSKKPSATVEEIKNAILNSLDMLSNQDLPRGRARLDKALDLLN